MDRGFVIYHAKLGGYIEKRDGMNIAHRDPHKATVFATKGDAGDARPGHHRDMGGSGFSGSVVEYGSACADYDRRLSSRWGY